MNGENSYRSVFPKKQGRPMPVKRLPVPAMHYEYETASPSQFKQNPPLPLATGHAQQEHRMRMDKMQAMQARHGNFTGANDHDFQLVVAGPKPANEGDERKGDERKGESEKKVNGAPLVPLVPSYAKPHYVPDPSPESDEDEDGHGKALIHQATTAVADQAYPFVYRDDPFYQLPQSNLIVNPVPAYLTIDSRDRDRTVWPNTNQYKIPLVAVDNDLNVMSPNVRYKNIYSISLLSCVIPNLQHVLHESYLLLQINEIEHVYDSASPAAARAFTKLYFKDIAPWSKYLRLDKGVGDPLTKIYWPAPRASLDSITLSFRHPDGTLFDFGSDAPLPSPPLPDRQTSITLEIRTFVVDSARSIGHRNP